MLGASELPGRQARALLGGGCFWGARAAIGPQLGAMHVDASPIVQTRSAGFGMGAMAAGAWDRVVTPTNTHWLYI